MKTLAVTVPLLLLPAALCAQEMAAWNSVVLVKAETAPGHWLSGSGVVVAPGIVATNSHVLRGTRLWLVRKGNQTWSASILSLDDDRDLALLKVQGLGLPPAKIAMEGATRVAMTVFAIGYPGGTESVRRQGRITALWDFLGAKLLQTDAPMAPGSSGGGLFAEDGSLLGITTFALPVAPGFNFAVPARWALDLLAAGPGNTVHNPRMDPLLLTFTERMNQDPANAPSWEAFTRDWIAASPTSAEAWFARSHALDQRLRLQAGLGKVETVTLEKGIHASRRAVGLRPDHAKSWNNLGVALDLANDFPAAEAALRKALELDPGYGLAWLNLGGVRMNRQDWSGALAALQRGLERVPDDATGWARRALAESMLGRWPEALAHYRLALRYRPANLELWRDLRQACLRAKDPSGVRGAEDRIAALSAEH